jgi:arginyl-tRNA synthetase
MCGLFRKAAELGIGVPDFAAADTVVDEEWALLVRLRGFGAAVERACVNREPHDIAHYLCELTSAFNAFYNKHTVIDPADEATTRSRLAVVAGTRSVLAIGLKLLGIRPLEFM